MKKNLSEELRKWETGEKASTEKPRFFAGQCRLLRFSDYEYASDGPNKNYIAIRPKKDAALEWYQPFDHEPGLLRDYLELTNWLLRARNPEDQMIVEQMDNYLSHLYFDSEDEKQKHIKEATEDSDRKHGKRMAEFYDSHIVMTPTLEKKFLARLEHDKPSILDFTRKYGSFIENSSESARIAMFKEDLGSDEPFRKQDFLKWVRTEIIRYDSGDSLGGWYELDQITKIHRAWEQSRVQDKHQPEPADLIQALEGFSIPSRLNLVCLNGHWRIDFDVDDLYAAIAIMVINNAVSGRDQIRTCALSDCQRPFFTRDPRANYCCAAHSQRGRVRKFRAANASGE